MGAKRVGVVGATGAVGEELLALLAERRFAVEELRLFASARSAGTRLAWGGQQLPVEALDPARFEGLDVVFFSAGGATSQQFAPEAVERGALVIDNSSAFRLEPDVPLVVPEVNMEAGRGARLIANPNCTTILLAVALAPLHRAAGVERVVVATYQSASGAGARAMYELRDQARAVLEGGDPRPEHFPHRLAFNLFPQIDVPLPEADDFTREEMKVVWETRKILGEPELRVSCTAVRVPVFRAHSEAVHLELARPLSPEEARAVLAEAPGVELVDRVQDGVVPTPLQATGRDPVLVGRVRRDPGGTNGLALFLAGDQLRKGAALNAIQIAEQWEDA